jgi:hypothetical protein
VQQSKILINLLCTTRFLGNPCVATLATHESPFYISSEPTNHVHQMLFATRMSCCTSQLSLVQLSSTRNCTSPARGCKHHIIQMETSMAVQEYHPSSDYPSKIIKTFLKKGTHQALARPYPFQRW